MSDRQDPYAPREPYGPQDPYAQEQSGQQPVQPGYTYDAYGQPVYQQDVPQQASYDPYGQQQGQHTDQGQPGGQASYDPYAASYDPYGAQQGYAPGGQQGYPSETQGQLGQQAEQGQHGQQTYGYDPYGQQPSYPQQYDPYAQPQQSQQPQQEQQAQQTQQQGWIPQQAAQPSYEQQSSPYEELRPERREEAEASARAAASSRADRADAPDYRTEQFSFIEEPDEDSEDVIDWLKFTESRTERREEAKRRGRSRVVALGVVLALLVVGGVGYLWWAGKLPGTGADEGGEAAGGAQKRDVLVVHLKETKSGNSSTALLVDNETTHKGTTLLLPNSLTVATDDGTTTTLGKSVHDAGVDATRDSLNVLLGADIKASWRLGTPYLENLVETVGGITLDTDTTVPGTKKGEDPLVKPGKGQELNGQAAVAYATYKASGEAQTKQLVRFGQVMQATLKKLSSDAGGATATVKSLAQVLDPPLTESQLGSSLAQRAELAKTGAYATSVLPVQPDGTLSRQTSESVVKDVLGGTVKKPAPNGSARVGVQDATGGKGAVDKARIALVNGGYTVVDGGAATAARPASEVTYADAGGKARAEEVAKTLGLPTSAVKQGKGAANADVTVVLGQDYKG